MVVLGRGGGCLERPGGGWRITWGIVWALTHLFREDDAEDGVFLFVLHHVNLSMGQQYNDWVVVILVYCYHSSWLSFHLIFIGLFVTV